MPSETALLPTRQGVLPVFRRLPLTGLLLWLLTVHVSAAMLCLAGMIVAHGLLLSVWPSLVALLLNVGSSAMLTSYSQEVHRGGDPADLARLLYHPAFVVGMLLAISTAVPFFVLTA